MLQNSSLERIGDQALAVGVQELVEQTKSPSVGGPGQQMPGFVPEERIDFVQAELAAVGRGPHMQMTVEPVPEVLWIGMIEPDAVEGWPC